MKDFRAAVCAFPRKLGQARQALWLARGPGVPGRPRRACSPTLSSCVSAGAPAIRRRLLQQGRAVRFDVQHTTGRGPKSLMPLAPAVGHFGEDSADEV